MSEPQAIHIQYKSRINKTFDYIEQNLSKSFTLEELAAVAHFSKFHFNRIFHAMVGETPFQFVLRLRLEKAASQMLANKNTNITDIAFQCGFTDKSVFSRNFKQHFGISASLYRKAKRKNSNISQLKSNTSQLAGGASVYFCPDIQTIKWRTNMNLNNSVEVKDLPKMTVAYIRNMGPLEWR